MNVRTRSLIACLLVTGTVVACRSDSPSPLAPSVTSMPSVPSFGKGKADKTTDTVKVAKRKGKLSDDLTVSRVIGKDGGTLELKDAGLKIIVPKGAVSSNQTFTITAVAGRLVAYEFTPHMVFAQPIDIEQQVDKLTVPSGERVTLAGYFTSRDELGNGSSGLGTIEEALPVTRDKSGGKIKFSVTHFSGYLMASGRTSSSF